MRSTDEEANPGILTIGLRHLALLHLAARVNDEAPGVVSRKSHWHKRVSKGSRASRRENGRVAQHLNTGFGLVLAWLSAIRRSCVGSKRRSLDSPISLFADAER